MRIIVITSCTGEKAVSPDDQLTIDDFRAGSKHLAKREKALKKHMMRADELYTGQQHVRLMRGIKALRESPAGKGKKPKIGVDLHILSAGYGLVPADRKLAPYEVTFQGMKVKELRAWADQLNVPEDVSKLLATKYDLALLLLGDSYLKAANLNGSLKAGGTVLAFCGTQGEKALKKTGAVRTVVLGNREAKRFSCGLVGLKGELAGRFLRSLTTDESESAALMDPATDLLGLLDAGEHENKRSASAAKCVPKTEVDWVISIPEDWWARSEGRHLKYFIPEWDDLVDPEYDFVGDAHSGGRGDWSNEVYAHQMYSEPNYDGILVSRAVAEKSKKKNARINQMGAHRYIRVPRRFPIMGDCGAFDYIEQAEPPYSTDDVLDYYTRLDFDFGVSVDHLCVKAFEDQKEHRYQLTIHNAEEFLKAHSSQDLAWTPIGAVQGWDAQTYADAAKQYVKMGYRYIALGALVRKQTPEILRILQAVHDVVPSDVAIHLFGLARLNAMETFASLGVRSVDSASFLRQAWIGASDNYWTLDGTSYAAIRIPQVGKSFRAKRMVSEGRSDVDSVLRMETQCLNGLRKLRRGQSISGLLDLLVEYDELVTPNRRPMREHYRRTLEDRPWETCPCSICKRWGVEVVVFRGNNRNRRRGFHNTFVFYRLLESVLNGQGMPSVRKDPQQRLFD